MTEDGWVRVEDWQRLQEEQARLRSAIERSTDEAERSWLMKELAATREAAAQVVGDQEQGRPAGTVRVEADDGDIEDDGDIGDLLDVLLDDEPVGPVGRRWLRESDRQTLLRFVPVLIGVTLVANIAWVLSLVLVERPEEGYTTFWDGWVYHIAISLPAALVAVRAITEIRARWAWWLLSLGILLNAAGDLLWAYHDQNLDPIPFPAWSDVPYLECYLAFAVALVLITQTGVAGVSKVSRLNGLVIGLAAGALAVTLWFDSILEQSGSTAAVLVGLAYPLFDVVFIVIILSGLAPVRYRPSSAVATFIVGVALFALGDIIYLRQVAVDEYVAYGWLDATWVVGILLFGLAPWIPQHRWAPSRATRSVGSAVVPWIAAVVALGVIAWSGRRDVPELAVWLAVASVAMVLGRIGLTVTELRKANEEFSQAWIGEIAGLHDRGQPRVAASPSASSGPASVWLVALGTIATTALIGVGVLLWQVASESNQGVGSAPAATALESEPATVTAVEPEPAAAGSDAQELPATGSTVVGSESEARRAALQRDLNRLLSFTPIVFGEGETELTPSLTRVLNSVTALLLSSPGLPVTVVGYTDDVGSAESNIQLSTARATAVRDYLVSQGLAAADLTAEGRGEAIASGATDLAGFERRVEFEVAPIPGQAALPGTVRLGIVATGARNDLAFTQSMVDSLQLLTAERAGLDLAIVDNLVVTEDAVAAIRDMASQGYDLVIAHDAQLGSFLPQIASEFPGVTFAWGPTTQAPPLPNIYTYGAAAEQGGYVFGALAASLSMNNVIGVVGPIEAGDAQRYINGFRAGAKAEKPSITVQVDYTGSFLDASLAAETAQAQIDAGADVLTGSGPMATSAAAVVTQKNLRWFANQANQSSVAPNLVVASQVYHWDVVLRAVIADIDSGTENGRPVIADLSNGGLTLEFSQDHVLEPALAKRANDLIMAITSGSLTPPAD